MKNELIRDREDIRVFLTPTFYIDSDHDAVAAFAREATSPEKTVVDQAVDIYYAVRDGIRYDPFHINLGKEGFRASSVLEKKSGFCVPKAVLLAAAARVLAIPSRLRFADVRNHLTTERLRKRMETDLFIFHGYTELLIEDRWVKATPTFNIDLCRKFEISPLEFDGKNDAIFHAYDREGKKYMEYVQDRGTFHDLPYDLLITTYRKHYPLFFSGDDKDDRTGSMTKSLRRVSRE